MPILFSVVACDKTVLTKYATCDGNFTEILEQVLMKIPPQNDKLTYSHGHYLFHYIVEKSFVYFCITDKICQRSRAFLFLKEIKRKFKCKGKEDFTGVLAAEMHRYSEDYNTITIHKGDLEELNNIGVKSSETILGEKILFVNNTDDKLAFSSVTYVGKTPQRILVSIRESKWYMIIIVILTLLGLAIYILGPMTCCHFVVLVIAVKYILNK